MRNLLSSTLNPVFLSSRIACNKKVHYSTSSCEKKQSLTFINVTDGLVLNRATSLLKSCSEATLPIAWLICSHLLLYYFVQINFPQVGFKPGSSAATLLEFDQRLKPLGHHGQFKACLILLIFCCWNYPAKIMLLKFYHFDTYQDLAFSMSAITSSICN